MRRVHRGFRQGAAVALCALLGTGIAYPDDKAEYSIRADEPTTGSHIRSDVVRSGDVALNRPYEKLSAEDRAKFHAKYEAIAEGDEPPFPLKGLRAILKPIHQAQEKLAVRGEMFLVATVDPAGKVQAVKIMVSPDATMANFAAQVLLLTPFKPAVCAGQACTMDFPLTVNFRVD